jgi:tight adherence protein B
MGDKLLFIALLALTVAVVGALVVQSVFSMLEAKRRALQQRLGQGPMEEPGHSSYGSLVLQQTHSEMLAATAKSMFFKNFAQKLHRAYPGVILGRFLLLVGLLGGSAFLVGAIGMHSLVMGLLAAATAVAIPFMRVNSKVNKRLRLMDEQLPEALEFLSRILKAGHSLTTGFQMPPMSCPIRWPASSGSASTSTAWALRWRTRCARWPSGGNQRLRLLRHGGADPAPDRR